MIPGRDDVLGRAQSLADAAVRAGADQAEGYWSEGANAEVTIENGKVVGGDRHRSAGGSVRIVKDGRIGFAHTTDIGRAKQVAARALDLARLAPATAFRLPGPGPAPSGLDSWSDDVASLDIGGCVEDAKALVAAAKDAAPEVDVAGGGAGRSWSIEAIASSQGIAVVERTTHANAGVNLVLDGPDGAINVWDSVVGHDLVDGAPTAQDAARRALDLRGPKDAPDGILDVVLRPHAAYELLISLCLAAVDGDDAMRGKSVWSGRIGEPVAAAGLSLIDDPFVSGAVSGATIDGDGLATGAAPIIEDGVLRTFLFGAREASDHQVASTHHAMRGGHQSPPGVGAHHVIVDVKTRHPDAALVDEIDRGILVDSVLGAHTANTTTGDFSVTAPNVWRIDKGTLTPCKEVAIAGNLPALLQQVDAASLDVAVLDGAHVPSVRIRDVRVSS